MQHKWISFPRVGLVIGVVCAVSVLLSACAPAADIEDVLQRVSDSHTHWQTVQGEAQIVWSGPDGNQQEYVQQFAIAQPASARFTALRSHMPPPYDLWISDGTNIYTISTESQRYASRPVPAFAFDLSLLEPVASDPDPVAVVHPFSMLIESPIAQYVYPHWFPQQRNGPFELLREEQWLGRPAWVVQYTSIDGASLAWVDQATGVILRFQHSGYVDFEMTAITFDEPIAADVFALPAGYTQE